MLNDDRILLVHPLGYGAESAHRDITRVANVMPPLGLASIAAYLEQQGLHADIVDCFAHPDSDDRIRELLRDTRPGFIGISCTTSSFADGVRLIELAKSELPEIKAIMGGAHISALREQILETTPQIDYTVIGEGERTVELLMRSGGSNVGDVPGIVFRDGDDAIFSGHQPTAMELDALPFPAYEKLGGYPQTYKLPIFNYPTAPNASCISSRGCPYQCSYCDRSVFRQSFRFNSAEYLYEHLRYLKERWGIRHINFYDDQFTFHRRRVKEFCNLMVERPLNMTFNCAVRAEHVDFELLKQMKSAGCWMISLGIETGDPELLARHRQNSDLELLADRIRDIKRAKIRTKGLLMMGLPGETEESIQRSMAYVASLPIDDFNLTKFTPFPGSPVHETIREFGTFNEDPALMDCMHFVFVPNGFTEERLEKLYGQFYAAHYRQPGVWMSYMSMIWRSPDSWRRFIRNFGSFLEFVRSSERINQE
jgi:anaerobic magnesium-protoporphyrin IX monomethyl ester cyclase